MEGMDQGKHGTMDGMNNGTHGMDGMNNETHMHMHEMMMHMTFFWGKDAEILFSDWPGTRMGMYVLALVFVCVLSVLIEWLSHCRLIMPGSDQVMAGLAQTFLHAVRVGLAYLVMLAVMSFNVGVLLVAIAGHAIGFFLFRRSQSSPDAR